MLLQTYRVNSESSATDTNAASCVPRRKFTAILREEGLLDIIKTENALSAAIYIAGGLREAGDEIKEISAFSPQTKRKRK